MDNTNPINIEQEAKTSRMVPIREKNAYGLYFAGQNVFYLFILTYIQNYFTDYLGISATIAGVILLVARIWDAVNDPMFGVIVDKSRLKGGRFIPWIKISTFIIPIVTILLFAIPISFAIEVKIGLAAALYILWGMSYTICDVPIFSLATAMTSNVRERSELISFGRFLAFVGIVLTMVLTVPLVGAIGWFWVAVIYSIVGMAFMLPISFRAKERTIDNTSKPITIGQIFKYLISNKYLLIFYVGLIISSLTNTAQTLGLYFATVNLGNESLFMVIMAAVMGPMVLVAALLPNFIKKFDKFHIFMFGLAVTTIFSVIQYFAGYSNFIIFLIISVIRGLGLGISGIMPFMFSSDCVEYGTYKSGKRAEGATFSIQTFATKMTGAISAALALLMLGSVFGYIEAIDGIIPAQPQSAVDGIWFMFSIFPAFGQLAAFILLLFTYKLRDKDIQIMADINSNKISRQEGDKLLSRKY